MNETLIIAIVGGLAVGGFIGWLLAARSAPADSRALDAEARAKALQEQAENERKRADATNEKLIAAETERATAVARAKAAEENLAEQKALLDSAEVKLREAFSKAASDALATSNKSFLDLAETRFKNLQQSAASDLDARKTSIDALVNPIRESLDRLQKETQSLEASRQSDVGALKQQLESLAKAETALQSETNRLVTALKSTKVRGRWGEVALQNLVEMAGMKKYQDFETQQTSAGDNGDQTPDMTFRLPGGRKIIVDSKVPLDSYLAALEAPTDEARATLLARHLDAVRAHVKSLSKKEYWKIHEQSLDFVIMFIPNDSFLSAAEEQDHLLIEAAMQAKVILATPSTLMALLKAIAYGWRQAEAQESALEIQRLGQELADRIETLRGHFEKVGEGLDKAVSSFNNAVGSFESMLLPQAKRFKELGAGGKKELGSLEPIDKQSRKLPTASE